MCKKLYPMIALIVVMTMVNVVPAATTVNDDWLVTGTRDWFTATNWNKLVVPVIAADYLTTGNYGVRVYNSVSTTDGPIIAVGNAQAIEVRVGGGGAAGGTANPGYLTMNSGTLATENFLMIGPESTTGGGRSGTFLMNNGTVTLGGAASGVRTSGHLYVGNGYAGASGIVGTLTMTNGTIDVGGNFTIAVNSGTTGRVYLNGGTIKAHTFGFGAGTGSLDIAGGTLIIDGDVTTTINSLIGTKITAYGGTGVMSVDYGTSNAGKTTVKATGLQAINPSPANAATNTAINVILSWTAGAGATSHNVYFGTTSPGASQGNQTATAFNPGALLPNTTYYWRIDEVSGSGTTTGTVWSFTTTAAKASNPNPANGATGAAVNPTLTWAAGAGAVSHDVYFGTTSPGTFQGNQPGTSFSPGTLTGNVTYFWRIDEKDGSGNTTTGDVWSFTTQSSIVKGPYLIYPGNNTQMTVLWQLPSTQSCTLAWGTDTTYSTGTTGTTEYGSDHQHKYTITGLTPGTKYYYRLTSASGQFIGSFRTAPASDATSVKFFAYGDTRTNAGSNAAVLAQMNSVIAGDAASQTMLLHVGDWSESDSETNWNNEFFNRSYPAVPQLQANVPIMGCIGNHELTGTGISVFDKYWPYTYAGSHYYSFDYGPVHVAVLDQFTTTYSAGSAQITWLANDLAASSKKWKIIILHQPGWCAGGSHPNDTIVQSVIQPLCEQYGVQVVFAGHNHYYSRAVVNGVHHVTTGSGGAPFYTASAGQPNIVTYTTNTLEFCKVNINGDSMGVTTVSDSGIVIDSFYVNKGQPDLTFVQVTDVQIGMEASQNCPGQDTRWQKAVSNINIINPAFVMDTGDVVQSWSVSSPHTPSLDTYLSIAAGIKPGISLYHVPGNHDIGDAPAANRYPSYLSVFPNPYPLSSSSNVPWYSFSYGNTLFIVLDTLVLKNPSSYVGEDTVEINWLTNTLQNSSGYTHKIVFTHVPMCQTSVTEPTDSGGFNMPIDAGNNRAYSNIRATLLNLFHTYGVEAVFCGHAHVPYYVNDNGLELVTTETTTCPLGGLSTDTTGLQIVKIYPDHIEHSYRTLNSISSLQPGDFNSDGIVDWKDMGIFSGKWLQNGIWP